MVYSKYAGTEVSLEGQDHVILKVTAQHCLAEKDIDASRSTLHTAGKF